MPRRHASGPRSVRSLLSGRVQVANNHDMHALEQLGEFRGHVIRWKSDGEIAESHQRGRVFAALDNQPRFAGLGFSARKKHARQLPLALNPLSVGRHVEMATRLPSPSNMGTRATGLPSRSLVAGSAPNLRNASSGIFLALATSAMMLGGSYWSPPSGRCRELGHFAEHFGERLAGQPLQRGESVAALVVA